MPSRYLRCDRCNDPKNDFTIEAQWSRDNETLAEAQKVGWRIGGCSEALGRVLRIPHICPKCVATEDYARKCLEMAGDALNQSYDECALKLDAVAEAVEKSRRA